MESKIIFLRKIRQKRTSEATGTENVYESLQLVESCRTEAGPGQKLLLNLGPIPLEKRRLQSLYARAASAIDRTNTIAAKETKIQPGLTTGQ